MLKTYHVKPSLRSHILNGLLRLTSKQTPRTNATEAHCRAYIDGMANVNSQPFPSPAKTVGAPVEEHSCSGMQTFIWGRLSGSGQQVLLYLHGGAYMNPPTSMHFKMLAHITRSTGSMAVFPIYPKIPDHDYTDTFPALLDLYDSLCAEHGAEAITLMGDSSGGGLALGFAYYLADQGRPQPRRLLLICPWLDLHTSPENLAAYEKTDPTLSPWRLRIMGQMWAGDEASMDIPYVSPIFGDPAQVAPITIITGTREVLYPDVMKFHRMMDSRHIAHRLYIFEGMSHVFPAFPIPEAAIAQKLMIHLLNQT